MRDSRFRRSRWRANTTNRAARKRTHRISRSASRRMSYIEGATPHGIGDLFPHYLRAVGRRSTAGGEARLTQPFSVSASKARVYQPFSVSPVHLSDRTRI